MAKISTYPVDGLISTDDFIIGSDAENVNITKNFTVGGILSLANLQTVLDNGNTATQSITLVGNVAATNVSATTLLSAPTGTITNVNSSGQISANDVEIAGLLYDAAASEGNNGEFLKSTGTGIMWSSLPVAATPTLTQVLTSGNTTALNIVSTGDVDANSVNVTDAAVTGVLTVDGTIEANGSEGTAGQYLKSAGAGQPVEWATLPSQVIAGWNRFDDGQYTDVSPLTINDGQTVTLTNDGVKFQAAYGTDVFYNDATSTVLAINQDDTYMITVTFRAAASNASSGHMDISMTGPAGYDRISETLKFAKGNGVAQNFHLVYQYYADADFVANGAQFELTADGTTIDVWDIIYFIQRVQIA